MHKALRAHQIYKPVPVYSTTFAENSEKEMELRAGQKTARIGLFNKTHLKVYLISGSLDLLLKDLEQITTKTQYTDPGLCFDEATDKLSSFQFESQVGAKFEYELV
jgi:hypothetical protein